MARKKSKKKAGKKAGKKAAKKIEKKRFGPGGLNINTVRRGIAIRPRG